MEDTSELLELYQNWKGLPRDVMFVEERILAILTIARHFEATGNTPKFLRYLYKVRNASG